MSDQREIIEALEAGAIAGGIGPTRRIETHLSEVFLGANRVIKLKRAVRLPFVDFTGLEARRASVEAELAINRRTAPALYLGAQPLTRAPGGGFALGGDGEALDWVLVMRRFRDDDLFDAMAREGRLSVDLIRETAELIAEFHETLPRAERKADRAYYARVLAGLAESEADGTRRHGFTRDSGGLYRALENALSEAAPLIDTRAAAGHVRRGHGDLHLRNLCLFEGKPTLFDALEFDEGLATHDTLYDFAFLLMDLLHRGLDRHANAAMNRYWDRSAEDEGASRALPFFMGLRAAVRMAIEVEAGREAAADEYRALGLALLRPRDRRLVAIGGLSGSGKSVLAQALAPELGGPCGARLLRSDVIRKRLAGAREDDRLAPGAYTQQQRGAVYEALVMRARVALGGACVIADATFRERAARDAIAGAGGDTFIGLWLRAPQDVRVRRAEGRLRDVSDATGAVAAAQEEPADLGAWHIIDASVTPEETLARARAVVLPRTN